MCFSLAVSNSFPGPRQLHINWPRRRCQGYSAQVLWRCHHQLNIDLEVCSYSLFPLLSLLSCYLLFPLLHFLLCIMSLSLSSQHYYILWTVYYFYSISQPSVFLIPPLLLYSSSVRSIINRVFTASCCLFRPLPSRTHCLASSAGLLHLHLESTKTTRRLGSRPWLNILLNIQFTLW